MSLRKVFLPISLAFSLSLLSLHTQAASAVNLSAGTHGVAIEYFLGLSPAFNARFVLTEMPVDLKRKDADANINIKYDRTNLGLLFDFRPTQGAFHITTGLYVGDHNIDINAKVNDYAFKNYKIGDESYKGRNLGVKMGARFNKAQPYLGVGWGNNLNNKGFAINFDMGLLYIGKGAIYANATGEACLKDSDCSKFGAGWFNVASDAMFQDELEKERSDLQKDAKKYQFAPILQLGLGWKF